MTLDQCIDIDVDWIPEEASITAGDEITIVINDGHVMIFDDEGNPLLSGWITLSSLD